MISSSTRTFSSKGVITGNKTPRIISPPLHRSLSSYSGERMELNQLFRPLIRQNTPWNCASPRCLNRLAHKAPEQNHSAVRGSQLFTARSQKALRRLVHHVFLAYFPLERNVLALVVFFNFFFRLFLLAHALELFEELGIRAGILVNRENHKGVVVVGRKKKYVLALRADAHQLRCVKLGMNELGIADLNNARECEAHFICK